MRLLDAGCGTGGLLHRLERQGTTVEGIDISPLAVQYCNERGLSNIRVADLNTVVLPANHYDAIVSLDVLYHRGIADVRSVLQHFFDALKPGGLLFLHLPAFETFRSYHDQCVHTERRFRLGEIKRLLRDTGFSVEWGSYRMAFLLPAILLMRACRTHVQSSRSDLHTLPSFINAPFLWLSRLENTLSRACPLPCGLSLYVLARKPVD